MRKLFGVMALAALAAVPARGQERPFNLGAQLSWGDDADLGLGVRYENRLDRLAPSVPLRVIGSFDWFFPGNDVTYWELNANVAYQFTLQNSRIGPYAGGGLNIARASVDVAGVGSASDTEVGLNLLGGIRFPSTGRLTPYVEIRLELGGGEQFVLTGGLLFF